MESHQVLIAGAGPAGLAAAATLGAQGIDVLVVEKRREGSPLPRATVLSLRMMEMLRTLGLEQAVLAGADDVEMTMREMPSVARAAEGSSIDVGYPTRAQSRILSPTQAVCVAQDFLENVLRSYVSSLDTVTVRTGVEVVDAAERDGVVLVSVQADDVTSEISARYLIGADGARSAVRTALGIEMAGGDELLGGLLVEFRAPLWEVLGPHRHLIYWIAGAGYDGTLIPAGQGDRWLFGPRFGDDVTAPDVPSDDLLADYIRRCTGVTDLDIRIRRVGWFTSGAQLADRFSEGNTFLIGDAAHRVTPRGGTGLNIALADGFHLGWKLAWVLHKWASPALLETYEAERRPAVAHNVARSSDPLGSRRDALTEVQIDLGGRMRHVVLDDERRSTLDAIGPGFTLFAPSGSEAWKSAAVDNATSVPIAVVSLDPLAARQLGIGSTGAMLVRPDGLPVATWSTATEAATRLREAAVGLTGTPSPRRTRRAA